MGRKELEWTYEDGWKEEVLELVTEIFAKVCPLVGKNGGYLSKLQNITAAYLSGSIPIGE
jgi:hypothetical protein